MSSCILGHVDWQIYTDVRTGNCVTPNSPWAFDVGSHQLVGRNVAQNLHFLNKYCRNCSYRIITFVSRPYGAWDGVEVKALRY